MVAALAAIRFPENDGHPMRWPSFLRLWRQVGAVTRSYRSASIRPPGASGIPSTGGTTVRHIPNQYSTRRNQRRDLPTMCIQIEMPSRVDAVQPGSASRIAAPFVQ